MTTQKKLSLKYEKKSEPTQAASAARTGLTFNLVIIGAVIEAAVIIATVPLPCIKRIKVAIIKGNKIGGIAVLTNELAMTSPTPLSLIKGKYYIVDVGLRNYLLGFRNRDIEHIIENIVYFELLRRGYDVAIGKIGENEIDFIVTNINTKIYIQVTENMASSNVIEKELAPFYKIQDNFAKVVITNDETHLGVVDGIKIIKLIDFLLDKDIFYNF